MKAPVEYGAAGVGFLALPAVSAPFGWRPLSLALVGGVALMGGTASRWRADKARLPRQDALHALCRPGLPSRPPSAV